jgi:DNA-binding response OmpR family regulator
MNVAGTEILIVEDDPEMAAVLRQGFEQEELIPTVAGDGVAGMNLAREGRFDAIVLDVMLPVLDGFEVASRLRKEGNHTPILLLTARDSVTDVVRGLDCGAEDYLTKPFSFLELTARIRALIRRGRPQGERLRAADLVLDLASHQVTRSGRSIQLSRTEFTLLGTLLRSAGGVVTRGDLVRAVWGPGIYVDGNNLDVTISSLRNRVDKGYAHRLIRTVRGFGYRIEMRQDEP